MKQILLADDNAELCSALRLALETRLDLRGLSTLTGKGTAIVLTSATGKDENSLAEPKKVSPVTQEVTFSGANLTRAFPGNSLTILPLRTRK